MSEIELKTCPICGKSASAKTKPFCSVRCADVDLGRWLSGSYTIPVASDEDDGDSDDGDAIFRHNHPGHGGTG